MATHTTPAQYALILIDLAREHGIEAGRLLAGSGLAAEGAPGIGARVSDGDFQHLAATALALIEAPDLGLQLGERLNLSAHAILGQAFMTCLDLAEVLQLFERYYPVLAPDLELEFVEEPRLTILITTSRSELPQTFGLEVMAAALRNTLDGLLTGDPLPLRFDFPYPAPDYRERYVEVLGNDIRFDRPQAAWSLPKECLERRLPGSNPALRRLYEAECARLLADLEDSEDLAAQTRRLLRKLEGQYPRMPQIAAMLNVSTRTYRRRLAAEGCSYQELLDAARAEHATRHLREGRLPVASIAYHLGFSDPSNFRRAYRRWTGRSPAEVRAGPLSTPR